MRLFPFGHESSQRLVGAVRRHNVERDELVAAFAGLTARDAFAA
jgi:hypothetical protein